MSAGKERGRNLLIGFAIGLPIGYFAGRLIVGERNTNNNPGLESRGFSGTLKEYQEGERLRRDRNLKEYLDKLEEKYK